MKSVKQQPARCFDYTMRHISMFPRLAVLILESQGFKINTFCFNLFLFFTLKMFYSQNIHMLKIFFKHMFFRKNVYKL